jgi:hypothetical protein
MPTYFPQLNSAGTMVHLPSKYSVNFLTTKVDLPSGPRLVKSWRNSPLRAWELQYAAMTDSEATALQNFFDARLGPTGEFVFLDPWGNLVQYSETFSDASWVKFGVTVGSSATDPFSGSRAVSLTGSGAGSYIKSTLPCSGVSGWKMCTSVWVKASTSKDASVGVINDGSTELTTVTLSAGQWTRISHSFTAAGASAPEIVVGIGTGAMTVFGAKASSTPGPGEYVRSPLGYGYRSKCRFDMEDLDIVHVGPNENNASVRIREIK